jgi:hypothetical protein
MAVAFAYQGKKPKRSNWFCTDQDVVKAGSDDLSPECQRYDLTIDPYGFWRGEMSRAVDVYKSAKVADESSEVSRSRTLFTMSLEGMLAYAATAEKTFHKWSNWQSVEDRPDSPEPIRDYIAADIKNVLCQSVGNPDWPDLKEELKRKSASWKLDTEEFSCPENVKGIFFQ